MQNVMQALYLTRNARGLPASARRYSDMREDADKTQAELAAVLNVGQTTYSRYENGVLDIPSIALIALARYYQVSTDYLLGLTDERKPYPLARK